MTKAGPTDTLGVQVSPERCHLIVNAVNEGLVQLWNQSQSITVQPGDRITSVNGYVAAVGQAIELRERLAKESELRIGIARVAFILPVHSDGFNVEACRYFARGCRFGDACRFSHLVFENIEAIQLEKERLDFDNHNVNSLTEFAGAPRLFASLRGLINL